MKTFNFQDLLKSYITNKRLAKKEKDPVKSLEYENRASSIRYVLELNSPTLGSIKNHRRIMDNDVQYLQSFGEYAPFIRMFDEYEPIDAKLDESIPIKPVLSRLMMHTRGFYQQLRTKYYKNVYSVMADKESIFKLTNGKKGKEAGVTLPLADGKSFYISIQTTGTLQDYISFVHEFSHVNAALINPDHATYNKSCLFEVDALLMEMLDLDFINGPYDKESAFYKIDIFNDYVYSARIACEKMNLLAELTDKELNSKSYLESYLKSKGYSDDEISDVLFSPIDSHYNYIYACMVAIELYFRYLSNKDEALDLLESVINLTCDEPGQYIQEVAKLGIVVGEHVNDYRNMLMEGYSYGQEL